VSHLDKILAHAERELVSTKAQRPTDVLPLYKKFLKIEEHRLRLRHRAGGGGREVSALRVELVDVLLRHVFSAAAAFAERRNGARTSRLALLALGGYGRGELNPSSDVDVMFLHTAPATDDSTYVGQMVEQVLYLLWDIGFKVGHSTRSIKEAVAQANRDMHTKTAMLESRHIAGDGQLVVSFREQFRAKCVRGYEREYIELRMNDQAARHSKHQNSVYVQEPDVKRGCGGLRDYQNLLWMTYFKEGALSTKHLVGRDWLSEADRRDLEVAYDFLLRVRSDLHYLTRRATDVLRLSLQERIANRLGYAQRNPLLRSEAFMKDYYEHTRNVFRITERITQQFASGESSGRLRALFSFLPVPKTNQEYFEGFSSRQGKLYAQERDIFTKEPELMMRAFQLAQERSLDISPDLAELVTRRLRAVTRTYQYAKQPREMFKCILKKKGAVGRTLRMMHRIDFLGRYIPEFGGLTCLVQHEFFHRYTADEHTLVCIEKLDALMQTENPRLMPYRKLLEKLEEPLVLYLALLLHDTGKAVGARPHSEASALFAQRVAARLQLSSEQRKSLILLVDHHLTLSNIAKQRNLDDPETAIEFAKIVKDQRNLDALMLLTLADGQGTSADAWSDWKESLVWHLYHETSRYLADQQTFHEETRIHREALNHDLRIRLSDEYWEEIDAHFEFMPDNYFRAFEIDDIASHLQLFRKFFTTLYHQPRPSIVPAIKWEAFPEQGHSIASFCSWDRQELLAKIAGSFSTIPINILSADIYTRGDHLVLDVFRVSDARSNAVTDERAMAQVEETLRHSLENEQFDFQPLIAKARVKAAGPGGQEIEFSTQITVDNKAHPAYTLVQVQTPDRLGLLYDILSCLGQAGIYIALSRISTDKGAAIDTFYVADAATHGKITEGHRISALQKELQRAALPGLALPS
jgi:[protein-PII] uridylyltransferase